VKPYSRLPPVEKVAADLLIAHAANGSKDCLTTTTAFVRRAVAGGFDGPPEAALGTVITSPNIRCEITTTGLLRVTGLMYASSVVTLSNLTEVIETLRRAPWLSSNSVASSSGVWISRVDSCISLLRDSECLDSRRVTPSGADLHALVLGSAACPK